MTQVRKIGDCLCARVSHDIFCKNRLRKWLTPFYPFLPNFRVCKMVFNWICVSFFLNNCSGCFHFDGMQNCWSIKWACAFVASIRKIRCFKVRMRWYYSNTFRWIEALSTSFSGREVLTFEVGDEKRSFLSQVGTSYSLCFPSQTTHIGKT